MYIPKNSSLNLSGARTANRRKNRFGIAGALLLLIGMVVAAMVLKAAEPGAGKSGERLAHDLDLLWSWSDQALTKGAAAADWTFRWDAEIEEAAEAEALINRLFTDEKGEIVPRLITNDGASMVSEQGSYFGVALELSVHIADQRNENSVIMVLLGRAPGEGGSPLSLSELRQAINHISGQLSSSTSRFEAGMKAGGFAKNGQGAVNEIVRLSQARQLDQYGDRGTWSATYHSSQLLSETMLDRGRQANLQISAHKHTERGETELVLGVPLISGDFSTASGKETETASKP